MRTSKAFDALSGTYKWYASAQQFNGPVTSMQAPKGSGVLLVQTDYAVYALNSSSGHVIWVNGESGSYSAAIVGVFNGVVSVQFGNILYGLDLLNNGKWLWQHNVGSLLLLPTSTKGVVAYECGGMFCIDTIDVGTGEKTPWAVVNNSEIWSGNSYYDVSNKMVAVLCNGYPLNSMLIFDSASGKQVAQVANISSSFNVQGCVAGLCIASKYDYQKGNVQLTAMNYLTWSLAWNITVPIQTGGWYFKYTFMRSNLLFVSYSAWSGVDNPAEVIGIDPTSGTFWTQPIGKNAAFLLQQLGSSQVLVGSKEILVLANI